MPFDFGFLPTRLLLPGLAGLLSACSNPHTTPDGGAPVAQATVAAPAAPPLPASGQVSSVKPVHSVRVLKAARKLQLLSDGKVIHEFHVALGGNPVGAKTHEGDGKTPEGDYTLDYKNSGSAFYKAIHISYPNRQDIAAAKSKGVAPGGRIMIHGQKNGWSASLSELAQQFDWTKGCIALTNAEMDIVWSLVAEGTPIQIRP